MAENSAGSPVFADRYRFQPVSDDWDRGRSGFTHLVFDMKKERLGVIKRAELQSQQAVDGLKNEIAALLDLKGMGVPEVYDTGEAEYGSKNYFYMVIEYIDGLRIEKNVDILSPVERADILTQFFGLLTKAHQLGIVNGDVDLKHLFWHKDKKQLIVIDWGNAKLDTNPKNKVEFSYDIARSAEIIYSLTTLKGHPSATGSIALPNDSSLIHSLTPLPSEFRILCKWAPRTPSAGVQSPYTAQELFNTSKEWQKAVKSKKSYKPRQRLNWGLVLFVPVVIVVSLFLGLSPSSPLHSFIHSTTDTPTATEINIILPTASETIQPPSETPLLTPVSTETEAISTETATAILTPTSTLIPSPREYAEISSAFDKSSSPGSCWTSPPGIGLSEGFSRRTDGHWRFGVGKDESIENPLLIDFSSCFPNKKIDALALNAWVARLELERDNPDHPGVIDAGKEFGIFIEDTSGQRREYTIWIDKSKLMHLRVRENGLELSNDVVLIVNEDKLKTDGVFPRIFAVFPIQIFFEINNNGLDIIYLKEGTLQLPVATDQLDPTQMTRIDKAIHSALGEIKKIGLIGYGGETQTVIWPLVFYGE